MRLLGRPCSRDAGGWAGAGARDKGSGGARAAPAGGLEAA
ncbi:hypothetical protein chiPu_0030956, partial [Chiloscyllium punctatum]|nr:hypothetical protein [Chiloscyllium punctatum]